jgi:polyketide biosynthesis enoyl-CoA hydratase PksH
MYRTLQVTHTHEVLTITLDRLEERNALNSTLIQELSQVLSEAELNTDTRIILLKGQSGVFCTGMDFSAVISSEDPFAADAYMLLLRRLATIPRIVIACVDGAVIAGGLGLIAASDFVIATPSSHFSLSEAIWGLLPCCVTPYLIRRVGFQAAYRMTLSAATVSANDAQQFQLVDVVTQTLGDEIRKQCLRFKRLHPETIGDLKRYFCKMWPINETMEKTAIEEINRLIELPRVRKNLENYVEKQCFPWEVH